MKLPYINLQETHHTAHLLSGEIQMFILNAYIIKSYCQTQHAQLYTKTQENIESEMTKIY